MTNTSPILKVDELTEEATVPGITSQAGITQADTQEETLQPESSEPGQNTGPTEVQNTSNTDEREVQNLNSSQIEDNGIASQNDNMTTYQMAKILIQQFKTIR